MEMLQNLLQKLKSRFAVWKGLFPRPLFTAIWTILFAIWSYLCRLRGELSPNTRENWRIINMIPSWSWWIWVVIGLAGLLLIVLEGAYRLITSKDNEFNDQLSQKENAYKAMEERVLKAEEQLTTKVILSLKDCLLSGDRLYMMVGICNDGCKRFTVE
ncbi:MAG: hypothetical protein WAK96_01485, partial [Desulfobaccales bacterium]